MAHWRGREGFEQDEGEARERSHGRGGRALGRRYRQKRGVDTDKRGEHLVGRGRVSRKRENLLEAHRGVLEDEGLALADEAATAGLGEALALESDDGVDERAATAFTALERGRMRLDLGGGFWRFVSEMAVDSGRECQMPPAEGLAQGLTLGFVIAFADEPRPSPRGEDGNTQRELASFIGELVEFTSPTEELESRPGDECEGCDEDGRVEEAGEGHAEDVSRADGYERRGEEQREGKGTSRNELSEGRFHEPRLASERPSRERGTTTVGRPQVSDGHRARGNSQTIGR